MSDLIPPLRTAADDASGPIRRPVFSQLRRPRGASHRNLPRFEASSVRVSRLAVGKDGGGVPASDAESNPVEGAVAQR